MARILKRTELAPKIVELVLDAPDIARQHKPGQFIILRPDARGERVPMSVANVDLAQGTITTVIQEVGVTSAKLCAMKAGEEVASVVGPLGRPTHIEKFGVAVCVGGGAGIPPLHLIAKRLKETGNYLISILGGRDKRYVLMENEMRAISDEVILTTDDGSYGKKGFVTVALQELIDSGRHLDYVLAIGPPMMMKAVAEVTRPHKIMTVASLNTIMIDGTGMCGACRVSIGGKTNFVCVDGPEFDAHLVDFDEMMKRLRMYRTQEQLAYERYLQHAGACAG
ncbi:MAG: sulfide/dihydroorotate dehydrogenase-like FAD/NAD-binding protein [Candidatus Sumerlaeia bacterium]|nr:sulfide/dihydroorotate dehydrogenase-like FAD/NAD-binding protein [Candidatus Sumerlaeia bacterium]